MTKIERLINTIAEEYNVPGWVARGIAWGESALDPNAQYTEPDGRSSYGLYQIHDIHGLSKEWRLDPTNNTVWAMQNSVGPSYRDAVGGGTITREDILAHVWRYGQRCASWAVAPAVKRAIAYLDRYDKENKEEPVSDTFRPWRLFDIARANTAITAITAWLGDLRHNPIESIQNEEDRTRELAATLLHFYNERLANVPSVPNLTKRTGDWVHNALTTIPGFGNGVNRWPLDSTYYLPTAQQMTAIIAFDWTDHLKYVANRFDCEDFAFLFKARVSERWQLNNVGLVIDWSGQHGYNVILLNDGTY